METEKFDQPEMPKKNDNANKIASPSFFIYYFLFDIYKGLSKFTLENISV